MKPYTLPELAYDCAALEPHYAAQVLALHHGNIGNGTVPLLDLGL